MDGRKWVEKIVWDDALYLHQLRLGEANSNSRKARKRNAWTTVNQNSSRSLISPESLWELRHLLARNAIKSNGRIALNAGVGILQQYFH